VAAGLPLPCKPCGDGSPIERLGFRTASTVNAGRTAAILPVTSAYWLGLSVIAERSPSRFLALRRKTRMSCQDFVTNETPIALF
jgi:hypothetical protein